ncbi:MAG: translesion error-prone DNA polymerase V autoproteolytic subunit, partial [Desulfobacterales bacterium]|nr:translesion error-prone DNA polymerase V autoproteolytic subunit [Desulfobacterales bacterium]MDD4073892.1 translesion error-prone DNA polymerase V autoproteolytic subunit [Desulfobacterales bacterium]MDD4393020.1 translesion error-prone DNA polymerase V autoproteolytic subunit [Desulfobacterales bacterium]
MITTAETVYVPDTSTVCKRPLFMVPVAAGFPSPAEDYIEGRLDLNRHLIKHPAATFFVRVTGDSMINAGIHAGDILIVDRAIEPVDKKVVIAVIDGELTVKRIRIVKGSISLIPENDQYQPIQIKENMEFPMNPNNGWVLLYQMVTSELMPYFIILRNICFTIFFYLIELHK